uniref:Uncharacterized protein n=1 Tax=Hyaloperonospora arabidopsidis (strain Emoy2) TaxID=559515 RepID=M4BJA3_HYAAE
MAPARIACDARGRDRAGGCSASDCERLWSFLLIEMTRASSLRDCGRMKTA